MGEEFLGVFFRWRGGARYMVWGHWGVQWNQRSSIWGRRPVRGIFNAHGDRILSRSVDTALSSDGLSDKTVHA